MHTVTFNVTQSGEFEFILPQEQRDELESGDVMGFSMVYTNVGETILPFSRLVCPGQPTVRYVYALALADTMDIPTNPDCREYSLQAIIAGKAFGYSTST